VPWPQATKNSKTLPLRDHANSARFLGVANQLSLRFYDFPRAEMSRLIPYLLVFVEILLFPVLVVLLVVCMDD
jgi:hypothetical protein